MSEKDQREKQLKKIIEDHDDQIASIDKCKMIVETEVVTFSEIGLSLDKAKSGLEAKKEMITSIDPNFLRECPIKIWNDAIHTISTEEAEKAYIHSLSDELENLEERTEYANASVGIYSSGIASGSASGYVYLVNSGLISNEKFEEIKEIDPYFDDVESIKQELNSIDPDLVNKFEEIISFWSIKHNYKLLLDIRAFIYTQILENYVDQSDYQRTNWYKQTQKGMILHKDKAARAKFFMIDDKDSSSIPPSDLILVDNVAEKMQSCYGDLSEMGKRGENNNTKVESVYKKTINTFASLLRLRKQFI